MSLKKCFSGLLVFVAMIMVVTTLGSHQVVAKSGIEVQPLETAKAIEVEIYDDYFKPSIIAIPNGKTTTLILKNKGQKEHTFTVEKLGIDTEVQPGKEVAITVQAKKPGTYELKCRYHYQSGMVGKVLVK